LLHIKGCVSGVLSGLPESEAAGCLLMPDDNDSGEILTQGLVGLSAEVVEQELPFALTTCGFETI
jgi:hypothetical protein